VILAAAYLLWLYQRVFFGKVENPKNEKLLDLSPRELATFIPLVAIAFWIGLYPKPFFQILSTPVNNLVVTVRPDYPGLNANKPAEAKQPARVEQGFSPASSATQVERPFRVASGTSNSNPSRLQPAAQRNRGTVSLRGRTADPSALPLRGSARDDNFSKSATDASLKARSTGSARDDNQPIAAAQVNATAAVVNK
jgi:hypothetical protein